MEWVKSTSGNFARNRKLVLSLPVDSPPERRGLFIVSVTFTAFHGQERAISPASFENLPGVVTFMRKEI
jgi:hypothetical protein